MDTSKEKGQRRRKPSAKPDTGKVEKIAAPRKKAASLTKKTTKGAQTPGAGTQTKPVRKNPPVRTEDAVVNRSMSTAHRDAIQSGRAQTRMVREYLDALENRRPRRGPRPNPAKMKSRIAEIGIRISAADPLERVTLHQERMDLTRQLETLEQVGQFDSLEAGFIAVAAEYSKRHGISADAWIAGGVPRSVVKQTGIA